MRSFNFFVQGTLHLERGLHQAKEKMQKAHSACKICSTLDMLYLYLLIIEYTCSRYFLKDYVLAVQALAIQIVYCGEWM